RTDALQPPQAIGMKVVALAQVPPQHIMSLAGLLWGIGTPPAQTFFAEVANDSSANLRFMMVAQCSFATDDLLPTALVFLRDKDPTGEVPRKVLVLAGRWPVAELQQLLTDAAPTARAAGLDGLRVRWRDMDGEQRDRCLAAIGDKVGTALRDGDPLVARSACQLMQAFAEHGPRAARQLWLSALPLYPNGLRSGLDNKAASQIALDDEQMQLALAAGRALGSIDNQARRDDAARAELQVLITLHEPAWTQRSIDALLELVELGYSSYMGTDPQWLARFFALAEPAQLVRFVRALPRLPRVQGALQQLSTMDLPPQTFPALCFVIDQVMAAPPEKWDVYTRSGSSRRGVQNHLQGPGNDLNALLWLVARTRSVEAPAWLSQLVDRLPAAADRIAQVLVQLSADGVGEPARIAMRRLLVWEGTPETVLPENARIGLFAELARLGDVPSIALFPRAYALGLGNQVNTVRPNPRPSPAQAETPKGIEYLALQRTSSKQPGERRYGYTDAQLVEAWRTLLASEVKDAVWQNVLTMNDQVPLAVLPMLAPELQTRWPADDESQQPQWWKLLASFSFVDTNDLAANAELRAAISDLLHSQRPLLGQSVLVRLRADVCKQFAAEARNLLHAADNPAGLRPTLQRAAIDLTTDDWLLILRRSTGSNLSSALDALPLQAEPTITHEVEGMLEHGSTDARAAACSTLARMQSVDSVQSLLKALRDPADKVRAAATEALQRIRFLQEQQAYWQNAKSGIDVSAASATAKLLAQAKPGEAKDQRLLAIRSLAVLGTAEALPYLIDWTKDADTDVATTARAAVARIHETAAKK
ncbi:MAG: HEAT repeat domain-containing protein, partial [Planctomycetota bacterium]